MKKPPQVRCEHCGKWVHETLTVTAYADTGCIAQACFDTNPSKAFWRAWVFEHYPQFIERIQQREVKGLIEWYGDP